MSDKKNLRKTRQSEKNTDKSEACEDVVVTESCNLQPIDIQAILSELLQSDEFRQTLEMVCHQTMDKVVNEKCDQMRQQIEKNESAILDMEKLMEKREKEIKKLNDDLDSQRQSSAGLERDLDLLQQYTRRNSVRIFGVPEPATPSEDTDDIAVKLAKEKLGFELDRRDIDRSHRVHQKNKDKPRPILVKLSSYKHKDKFMKNKKKLKGSGISIQEDLTSKTHKLLMMTSRHPKVNAAWTLDGTIFAAIQTTDGKNTMKKRIFREHDLANL